MKFEGEVVLQEKYGSKAWTRLYVKPPAQEGIVVLEKTNNTNVYNWFTKIFLPQGYPESVSKDYVPYQIWDTVQAFCSTIAGILATQEILRGVGVGDQNATPLAATVTWVVKDGCGHIGKILFAYTHGCYLDAYSKTWRLYADMLNDLAMCIEIALPYFTNYTTLVLCVSTSMKAIVGVAGGATRVAMTQHHALRGNMADVAAKDAAQETAVNLIASLFALLIINSVGSSVIIFGLMIVLHIIANYMAVRAVCLRTLNQPRFQQVIAMYLKYEVLSTPSEINSLEPIVYNIESTSSESCGFRIKLGYSIQKVSYKLLEYKQLCTLMEIYQSRAYLLIANIGDQEMYIIIKENATIDNILCSYFHAVLLCIIICAINNFPLEIYAAKYSGKPFVEICHMLKATEWARELRQPVRSYVVNPKGLVESLYEPSHNLLKYVDKIAVSEWNRILSPGLRSMGWDLKKHLLVADEWRICSTTTKLSRFTEEIESLHVMQKKQSSKLMVKHPIDGTIKLTDTFNMEPEKKDTGGVSNLSSAVQI